MKHCEIHEQKEITDKLREECGVFGIYDFSGENVASTIYYGLFALQHRGQESCGIAVSDTKGPKGKVLSHKGMGLVNEVFDSESMEKLAGDIGVGHVRYSTAGSKYPGECTAAGAELHQGDAGTGAQRQSDQCPGASRDELEYMTVRFSRQRLTAKSSPITSHGRGCIRRRSSARVAGAMKKMKGAYSLVVMSPRKLMGARDPFGFKPLCIGKRDNAYILASESCALDTIGAEFVRDVEPGEIVTITPEHGIQSDQSHVLFRRSKDRRAVFLNIFILHDRTAIWTASAFTIPGFRQADTWPWIHPVEADLVVGVPESGNAAALGYSLESGIPIRHCICEKRLCRAEPSSSRSRAAGNPVSV